MKNLVDIPIQEDKPKRRFSWLKWTLSAMVLLALAGAAGFIFFFSLIEDGPDANLHEADAIVVLTGGASRIPEAVKLLMQGKGERLLISGVYTATTRKELAALSPGDQDLFDCCIDLDRKARDTIGNADETSAWVRKHGFRSLIVVTDSYHMPRSLAEIRRTLPDTELIPFSVKQDHLRMEALWSSPGTLKLLAGEYLKFIPAYTRCVAIEIGRHGGVYGGSMKCLNAASAS
jgi:uncharacterized SAM-binding protein YcdF (DUF218 family)